MEEEAVYLMVDKKLRDRKELKTRNKLQPQGTRPHLHPTF
jgi:hypothetical protein